MAGWVSKIIFCQILLVLLVPAMCLGAISDPTRPPDLGSGANPAPTKRIKEQWQLTSTIISPQRHIAIINGETVAVGDSINKAKVISIRERQVTLQRGNRVFTLTLSDPVQKTRQPQ